MYEYCNGCLVHAAVKVSAELALTKRNHVVFAVKAGSAMKHGWTRTACEGEGVCAAGAIEKRGVDSGRAFQKLHQRVPMERMECLHWGRSLRPWSQRG